MYRQLTELTIDIKDKHIIGVPVAHNSRHLIPEERTANCHMLIILRREDKL